MNWSIIVYRIDVYCLKVYYMTYLGGLDRELLEAAGKNVTVLLLGTETDLDGTDVGLEATTNAGINTAGASPGALTIPGDTLEHITLVTEELGGVLLHLVDLSERNRHLTLVLINNEINQD